jgi:hypothetical protein
VVNPGAADRPIPFGLFRFIGPNGPSLLEDIQTISYDDKCDRRSDADTPPVVGSGVDGHEAGDER